MVHVPVSQNLAFLASGARRVTGQAITMVHQVVPLLLLLLLLRNNVTAAAASSLAR